MNSIETPIRHPTSAIHWACRSHNPAIVKMFLDKQIDIHRLDFNGNGGANQLVDIATDDEAIEILEMLKKEGYDFNRVDNNNNSMSLLEAYRTSISQPIEVIKWLVQNGADPTMKMKTNPKITIAEYTSRQSNTKIINETIMKPYLPKQME